MDEEEIERYKKLYLNDVNDLECFDYEKFLRLYNYYLNAFLDDEVMQNSVFYMNVDFLMHVAYGFSYFHDLIIGDEGEFPVKEVVAFSLDMTNRIREMHDGPIENYTLPDHIFARSWLCIEELKKTNLIEDNIELTRKLIDNNYKIHKVYFSDIKELS